MAVDIGEPEIATSGAIRELFVIEAEQVQDRRLHIVNVDGIFDDVKTEFIRRTVADARLHAAAREPEASGHTAARAVVDLAAEDVFVNAPGHA